jgi:predicted nucleotidyltransferase
LNIPNLGRNLPNMGIEPTRRTSLADALLTKGQQRVLGILFAEPGRSFPATELIARAGGGTGAVHRELTRLVNAGLVTVTPMGKQRRYQANQESPLFPELQGLVLKTIGLVEPLRRALSPFGDQIRAAFVYGSVAKGADTAKSDIDLMVIGHDVAYSELYAALADTESTLSRSVNPTIFSLVEWRERVGVHDHFVESVLRGPRLFVLGAENDLV